MLHLTRGTFWQYLLRNKLIALIPLLEASMTLKGYGQLDEISALYGLMWNTPKMMEAFVARMEIGDNINVGTFILKNGFQQLWKTIVKQNKLHITFNVTITNIKRDYDDDEPDIWIQRQINDGDLHWKRYDFLVWTPEIARYLHLFDNKWKEEEDLLSRATVTFLTTTLFSAKNQMRGYSPINYWLRHSNITSDNHVWGQRDTYAIMNHHYGSRYRNYSYQTENDNRNVMTSISYQTTQKEPSKKALNEHLHDHFGRIGAKDINVKHAVIWRYFPRYSVKDMDGGILWKILNIQGKYATWYIGSSVSFESIKSVIEYNKLLMKNTKFPKKPRKVSVRKNFKSIMLQKYLNLLKKKMTIH